MLSRLSKKALLRFIGREGSTQTYNAKTLVCSSGYSPSVAYFIAPLLSRKGSTWELVDSNHVHTSAVCWTSVEEVIISRYLHKSWLGALSRFHKGGGRVIYFMDDDLMDSAVLENLPASYRRKIMSLATKQRKKIEAVCDEYWVSTDFLAQKYAAWSPKLVSPVAAVRDLERVACVSVCYHGTSSHAAELQWLTDVVQAVHATSGLLNFEVFGDHATNRLFRSIPRVAVLHPMSWQNYLDYTASVARDIGLAPLLPGEFNCARGPTKFFDFVRMGAVGLYSDVAPYRGFIRHGVDGLLLPNDPAVWIDTIVALANDVDGRERMAAAARARALSLASELSTNVEVEHQISDPTWTEAQELKPLQA